MHETQKVDPSQSSTEFEGAGTYASLGQEAETSASEVTSVPESDTEKTAADYIEAHKHITDPTEYYALAREMRPQRTAIMEVAMQQYEQGDLDPAPAADLLMLLGTAAQAGAAAEIAKEAGMTAELAIALERIATPTVAPVLEHQLAGILQEDSPRWSVVNNYLRIAEAAQQRYPEEAHVWDNTIALSREFLIEDEYNDIRHLSKEDVTEIIDKRIAGIREDTRPDIIDLQHTGLFFGRKNDPDFHSSRSFIREEWRDGPRPPLQTEMADRTKTIPALYALGEFDLASPQGDDQPHPVLERLVYREQAAPAYAATIGIEAEIDRNVRLDRSTISHLSPDQQSDILYQRRLNQFRSEQAGVPADKDADWEFSHLPARHYSVLTREVQALMALNLVNPSIEPHPIHMTIGGVTTEGPTGKEPAVLLRALEATGWAASSQRLLLPQQDLLAMPDGTWAYGSPNGLGERPAEEIIGDSSSAVELRTLELKSLGGLERTLRTAYGLGTALSAFQRQAAGAELSSQEQELATIWEETSTKIQALLTQYGMIHPADWQAKQGKQESNGYTDGEVDGNFNRLAQLLDEADQESQSDGAKFQSAMQSLLISARSKAMNYL